MDILKNEFSSMKPLSYYLDDAVFFGCIMVVIHPWLGFGARTLGSLGECVCSRRCLLFCTCSPFALPRFPRAVHGAFLARSLASSGAWSAVKSVGESVMDRARGGWLDTTVRLLTRRNSVYVAFILTGALVGERVCSLSLSRSLGNPFFPSYSNESDL